jgi:hypothetical protein
LGAWPTMIHGDSEVLHKLKPGYDLGKIEKGRYKNTQSVAQQEHEKHQAAFENDLRELREESHDLPDLANFTPRPGAAMRDWIAIPVDAKHGEEAHRQKFRSIFPEIDDNEYDVEVQHGKGNLVHSHGHTEWVPNWDPDTKTWVDESVDSVEAVRNAVTRRILHRHSDLLAKHGPEKVGDAIDHIAHVHGSDGLSEIGTSDVSAFVNHVKSYLGEQVEYLEEKLTADDPPSKWISDFVKSKNPKFEGVSKSERIRRALGAYYAAKKKS